MLICYLVSIKARIISKAKIKTIELEFMCLSSKNAWKKLIWELIGLIFIEATIS